jgi:hypothetical protein
MRLTDFSRGDLASEDRSGGKVSAETRVTSNKVVLAIEHTAEQAQRSTRLASKYRSLRSGQVSYRLSIEVAGFGIEKGCITRYQEMQLGDG